MPILRRERRFVNEKSDLHTGDIVTLRDGNKAVVLIGVNSEEFSGDCIACINECGWEKLSGYNEDLTAKPFGLSDMRDADIVKVERCSHPYEFYKILKQEITD